VYRELDLNDHDHLWFPGLAADLVSSLEARAGRWHSQHYGADELTREGPGSSVGTATSWQLGDSMIAIEYPSSALSAQFSELSFATIDSERSHDQFYRAAEVLTVVDGLVDTVSQLVRTVYVLHAPFGYDVSHSDPELPFSIFVSLPQPGESDVAPRLAEAILHEAMHLQLTMIDVQIPLIADNLESAYSPWKHEIRAIGGLLHGLYVFAVVHQFCQGLVGTTGEWRRYGQSRCAQIGREVATIPELPSGLSQFGSDLWRKCRHVVLSSRHSIKPRDVSNFDSSERCQT
jgi:HEXXH motif-containing protein